MLKLRVYRCIIKLNFAHKNPEFCWSFFPNSRLLLRVMQYNSGRIKAVSKIWAKPKQKFGQVLVNCFQIILLTKNIKKFPFFLSDFARIFFCRFFIFVPLYFLPEFSPEFFPHFARILPPFCPNFWLPKIGWGTVPYCPPPPPRLLRLCWESY